MASALVTRIHEIYDSIVKLESLKPSEHVNTLLTHLVKLCIPPSNIIIEDLSQEIQDMRMNLIVLSGHAEGLLELEFATFLSKTPHQLKNLDLFPYYGNYVKLAGLEYKILSEHGMVQPKKVAFVGSGPLPLTSIVMATHHLKSTHFDNFDIDEAANYVASQIIASDDEFEKRMKFVTRDIMDVTEELGEYDCIFLAALVGICKEEKIKIVGHIRKYMKGGGLLLVRSANGARAFLYPVVKELDLPGFELLSIFHPTDEVINSVVLVRKPIFHD
ncbi:hypothetical protein ES332_D08G031800v1 [Gossypium tomentosum]|uniref:Nicotianamine synthase n=1 Tax=Gossypium tomentosum TaxID=34277 RepID=A0A5D2JP91_GOSTO|nr:hypothetical protein ES332_D08G031800v1 [Gossypium tomentosum]